MSLNDQVLDQEEMLFLHQIKKELQLENEQDAVPYVASILQALRQTLTLKNANDLLNSLPDFLKVVFATNWRRDEERTPVDHLDEFVNLVIARDRQEKKFLFKSEVQTLSVIILTLKKLYRIIDLDKFEGLTWAFKHELQETSTELVVV
jgi:uncharacterized protein (DUF2267 family)